MAKEHARFMQLNYLASEEEFAQFDKKVEDLERVVTELEQFDKSRLPLKL